MRLSLTTLVIALCLASCTDPASTIQPNSGGLPSESDKLEILLKSASGDGEKMQIYWRLYKSHRSSDARKALNNLVKLRQTAQSVENNTFYGLSHYGEGIVHRKQGDHAAAIAAYLKAIDIFEDGEDGARMADAYNNIGATFMHVGGYHSAIKYFEKAAQYYESAKDYKYLVDVYANIAKCHYDGQDADYRQAVSYIDKALEVQEAHNPADHFKLHILHNRLGVVSYRQKNYPGAIKNYQVALGHAERSGDPVAFADMHYNIADANLQLGFYADTEKWLGKARSIDKEGGPDRSKTVKRLNIAAELAQLRGDHRGALSVLSEAVEAANTEAVSLPLQKTLELAQASYEALDAQGEKVVFADAMAYERLEDRQIALERQLRKDIDRKGLVNAMEKEISLHAARVEASATGERVTLALRLSGVLFLFAVAALVAYRGQRRRADVIAKDFDDACHREEEGEEYS